jgi:glycosyltransferase 2 family protein
VPIGELDERPLIWEKINQYRLWLSIALGLVLLLLAFRDVELRQAVNYLREADPGPIIACFPIYAAVLWLRSLRWKYLLQSQGETSTNTLFPIMAIGYMANNLLPARAGDLARAWLVGEKTGFSKSACLATVLVERLFDAAATVALVIVLLPFLVLPMWVSQGLLGIAAVLVVAIIGAALLAWRPQLAIGWFHRLQFWLPGPIRERTTAFWGRFLEGLGVWRRPVSAAIAVAVSLGIWLGVGAIYYAVTIGMHVQASFWEALLVASLVNVAAVVPSPPSQLGVFEFFAKAGFGLLAISLPDAQAAALTVVTHTMLFVPAVVIGLACLWWEGQPLSLLRRLRIDRSSRSTAQPDAAPSAAGKT